MILQTLIGEFEHEVNNTRTLLEAVPEKDLQFKPSPISWTMGELAQHLATIYYWYVGTLTKTEYDLLADKMERGDTGDIKATLELFEKNVKQAREALLNLKEEQLQDAWTMKAGDKIMVGPMPRGIVIRNFLFNHVYHHRGEMIVYLRATGNKVPGLYGPTYEQSQGMKAG
ncbi:DinB family protein [uncultured Chitinophaga sp.]|uniref:DinB family protein n=1 Tax=uncultured Chitinophaga sp. TaxID=339340 RepID=UPI0025D57D92|nr:DinB family protein [uncultured Chitinophaga sp.]